MKRMIYFTLAVGSFLLTTAFQCGGPPPSPPPNGFQIHTQIREEINGVPLAPVNVSTSVDSDLVFAVPNATGTFTRCFGMTDRNGRLQCPDRVLPGSYQITERSGPCLGQTLISDIIFPGDTFLSLCRIIITRLEITPQEINVNYPPATLQLTGQGMTGMPVVKIVNIFGTVVATTTATQCNGSWLSAPCPDISFLLSGDYGAMVYNVGPGGSLQRVGGAWLYVYGNDPPPPPDPCGGYPPMVCQ